MMVDKEVVVDGACNWIMKGLRVVFWLLEVQHQDTL